MVGNDQKGHEMSESLSLILNLYTENYRFKLIHVIIEAFYKNYLCK
jgi:hypothetical protein